MVNTDGGKTRTVTYCGIVYEVTPGPVYSQHKRFWTITADGQYVTSHCVSLSKAQYMIHQHAVESGKYAEACAAGTIPHIRLK